MQKVLSLIGSVLLTVSCTVAAKPLLGNYAPPPPMTDAQVIEMLEYADLIQCIEGVCSNESTGEYFGEGPDGFSLAFPPGLYTVEEIEAASPYIMDYLKRTAPVLLER